MKAVIFDMDGVLIDSEPLWYRAEQDIFKRVGVPLTTAMCEETTGWRTDAVVAHWHARYPWQGQSLEAVAEAILMRVKALIERHGQAMAGVDTLLESFAARGTTLAIATSSPYMVIDAVVDKLAMRHYFNVMRSAVDEVYGKPHPAVYLTTARCLGVAPGDCLVFEDSVAGVQAAKAAGMRTVAVPAPRQYADPHFAAADVKLRSLAAFSLDMVPSVRQT
jgi:sugar-phosphatase